MKTNDLFYHVYSATDTPCNLTNEAHAGAMRTWLCPGCYESKPGVTVVDALLVTAPDKSPLNFVAGADLPIASKEFLKLLGDDLIQRELYIGRVFGPDGRELTDWATFRGKHRLIIRGTKEAQCRKCTECSRTLYYARGKRYLYPAPPAGVNLFESDLWGLVLTEETFLRAGIKIKRGIYIDKLPVLDAPKDAFGELVSD